jgi:hypothetical protein
MADGSSYYSFIVQVIVIGKSFFWAIFPFVGGYSWFVVGNNYVNIASSYVVEEGGCLTFLNYYVWLFDS